MRSSDGHPHDVIVLGASAGGVEALATIVRELPADLPAAVFVVLHVPAGGTSALPRILSRAGALPAEHPEDGQPIEPGHIYVAPPDRHLLVKPGRVRVTRGPRENGHRPAIDVLFRTAAAAYGNRVAGVVLTGGLDDGTAGLRAIKQREGIVLAQDPETALYAGMPRNAVQNVGVDQVLVLSEIAPALARLAGVNGGRTPAPTFHVVHDMDAEPDRAELEAPRRTPSEIPGTVTPLTCPECGGVMFEEDDGALPRVQCRVGHAYSLDTFAASQAERVEAALWTALRSLEERISVLQRLVHRMHQRGRRASRFEEQMALASQQAALLRSVLRTGEESGAEEAAETEGPDAGAEGTA